MKVPFAVRHTVEFVLRHVPSGSSLLDVGAGAGLIAGELREAGLQVTAFDKSPRAIELSDALGTGVRHGDLSSFPVSKCFDAVLLSMVAHHLDPLAPALERVRELLRPGGILIFEDYAVERADAPTAAWYYDALAVLEASGRIEPEGDHSRPTTPPAVDDPLRTWREEHGGHHRLNDGETMEAAIRERFQVKLTERGPYGFRYIAAAMLASDAGDHGERLYRLETSLIGAERVRALGLRIVATV
jgi:SAM-dependent methyltransferase